MVIAIDRIMLERNIESELIAINVIKLENIICFLRWR